MQESLSSSEAILSLARTGASLDKEEEEEEDDVDNINQEEEEDVDRLETLKSLTETVMSMIECSNRATKHTVKGGGSGRPQWPPERNYKSPTGMAMKTKSKEQLNNQNNSIQKENNNCNKEEKERLDKEFRDENNYENYVNYFKSQGILFPRSMWSSVRRDYAEAEEVPEGAEKGGATGGCEKNVLLNYQRDNTQRMGLRLNLEEMVLRRPIQEVDEEGEEGGEDCEYDSERGKFNCTDTLEGEEEEDQEEVNVGEMIEEKKKENFNANNVLGVEQKAALLVNKKIEYFENKLKPSKEDNRLRDVMGKGGSFEAREEKKMKGQEDEMKENVDKDYEQRKMINILCLGSFFMTAFLLYLFPLPN